MNRLIVMGLSVKIKSLAYYLFGFLLVYVVIDLTGLFRYPFEKDYDKEFSYPLDVPDFPELIRKYRRGEKIGHKPINLKYASLNYTVLPTRGCQEEFRLLILIKSAPTNFQRRNVIRSTWGYEKRFSDVPIKAVFLLGELAPPTGDYQDTENTGIEKQIQTEITQNRDILRANFVDSYYNNTLKFMMGMRWAVQDCSNFRFIFFVDDDMYVSLKNLLKFVRHPTGYPEYWESVKIAKSGADEQTSGQGKKPSENSVNQGRHNPIMDTSNVNKLLPDYSIDLDPSVRLYAGFVFFVKPHRYKVGTKWFLPISEYPFSYYPPYVPAGTIVMSRSAVEDIYYASLFTEDFRFDDVYVGICAKKMKIEPYHSDYFRFWPGPTKDPYHPDNKYVITAHQFGDPEELLSFWNIQKRLGHA